MAESLQAIALPCAIVVVVYLSQSAALSRVKEHLDNAWRQTNQDPVPKEFRPQRTLEWAGWVADVGQTVAVIGTVLGDFFLADRIVLEGIGKVGFVVFLALNLGILAWVLSRMPNTELPRTGVRSPDFVVGPAAASLALLVSYAVVDQLVTLAT